MSPGRESVCLFMTYGMTLRKWRDAGLFDREVLLYEELVRRGVRVGIVTYGDERELEFGARLPGVEIIPAYEAARVPSGLTALLGSLLLPWRLRSRLAGFAVLKTNQMWGAWVPLMAKYLVGARLVLRCGYEHHWTTVRQGKPFWKRGPIFALSKLSYGLAEQVVVTTQKIADYVAATFTVPPSKITVYPNLIDTELFKERPGQEPLHRAVFVGRLSPEKNLAALVEGAHQAGVGLDLVGGGELEPELRALAERLGADVGFLGILPNARLPELLSRYDAFVQVSVYEGNPKTLLEAMSCARAVIGSRVDGIRDLIRHEETGLLCEKDASSIAAALSRLMGDAGLRAQLGAAARRYVVEHCSIGRIADQELAVYGRTRCV